VKRGKKVSKQRDELLEDILPKKLSLIRRTWMKKDGSESSVYRMRVYIPNQRKYHYITLPQDTYNEAKEESITRYLKMGKDIEDGIPVNNDRKKLPHYIEMFMDYMNIRLKNGLITQHRFVCIRQLLRSLEKFAEEHRNPSISQLSEMYEDKFPQWRNENNQARLTGKTLSPRTRNNEYNAHKQFFGFLKTKNIVQIVPRPIAHEVHQTNKPFPEKYYNKLMTASRKAIDSTNHPRIKWNWTVMRNVILLMRGTGCRVTEVKNLEWSHISFDKRNDRASIYFYGKKKKRTIVVSNRVYGYLMELKEFKTTWGKSWGWNEEDYPFVFSSYKMKEMINQFDSWGRRQWMKEAGIEDVSKYPLVSFRHKFISDALKNGTHALQIAYYTGTSVKMIQQTYGSITPPDLFAQVFSNVPEEALSQKRTKWFDNLLKQGSDYQEKLIEKEKTELRRQEKRQLKESRKS